MTVQSIFGTDDRTRLDLAATQSYPATVTVRISCTWSDGYTAFGTGTLVGRNDILTAGHVVYSATHGGVAPTITLQPGYQNGSSASGQLSGTDVVPFSTNWASTQPVNDLAIVHTSELIGDKLGWTGPSSLVPGTLSTLAVKSIGYPADIDAGKVMVQTQGTVDARSGGLLMFRDDLDLAGGQSGSSLLAFDANGYPGLAGVLIGYRYNDQGQRENLGREIDSTVAAWLKDATGQEYPWTVDPGQNAFTIARFYAALFDRLPDASGLNYWVNQNIQGTNLGDIASLFLSSPEFKYLHGDTANVDAKQFLTLVYQQLLHRTPEPAGLAYWEGMMERGLSQAGIMATIAQSEEAIIASTAVLAGIHPQTNGEWGI